MMVVAILFIVGVLLYFKKEKEFGTTLLDNGACAYMTLDENGIAQCGIERAAGIGGCRCADRDPTIVEALHGEAEALAGLPA